MTSLGDGHHLDLQQDLEADYVGASVNLVRPFNLATLITFDIDADFATVKKLGSGVSLDMELRELFKEEPHGKISPWKQMTRRTIVCCSTWPRTP